MGKKNDAELGNILINTLRTITTRIRNEKLSVEIKEKVRPVFQTCRVKALTYHLHLQKENSDLAVEGESLIVKSMQENIDHCKDDLLLENVNEFDDYLAGCIEGLEPIKDENLDKIDLDSLVVAVPN